MPIARTIQERGSPMRVTIAGGNGYIGRALTRLLRQNGHEITWLSHTPGKAAGAGDAAPEYEVVLEPHDFDGAWTDEVRAADAVVNLSGYPISRRDGTRASSTSCATVASK